MAASGRAPSPPLSGEDMATDAAAVYVYGMTQRVTEPHLDEIFGFYGEIRRLRLHHDARLWADLEFTREESAAMAVSHMDQGQIDGATVTVTREPRPELEALRPPPQPARWKAAWGARAPPAESTMRDRGWPRRPRPQDEARGRRYDDEFRSREQSPP